MIDRKPYKQKICSSPDGNKVIKKADGNLPSLSSRGRNFAEALFVHAKAGFEIASSEKATERLNICKACDKYKAGRCELCGCFMKVKSTWDSMKCPIGKW